ncbi:replication-associated protein [Giant panda circovirus 3]|uniref:replication-associated protein n=1 Tax=Giant panda circovirus 3 TaxID=2016458 RepID=UPI000B5BFF6A|nr:replication-associated protein [Giant panda circovirus 3]ASH99189.1 replication-associated protein [Giant panda circovirus 3]
MPANENTPGKYWCFTSYHNDCPVFDAGTMQYLVYGGEICPRTERRHWQCYVEFKSNKRRKAVSKMFNGVHLERRNGTAQEAATYCKKDEQFVEHGSIGEVNQGRRTDIHDAASLVAAGQSVRSIAESNPRLFAQYGRGLTFLSAVTNSGRSIRWRDVKCQMWWGKTNLNKTRTWFDKYWDEGCYRFQYGNGKSWWDGYDGEKHILFDEFNCQILLSEMLMLTDGYPMRLECKGSHTYAKWETVTIISNDDPQFFYNSCSTDKRNAFARRFEKLIHFTSEGQIESEYKFAESSVGFFDRA